MSNVILRRRASAVSKDEWHERGRMVQTALRAPHHEG